MVKIYSNFKFHGGLPLDSFRLAQPFPRKVLNKISNANAQNFISQDNSSALWPLTNTMTIHVWPPYQDQILSFVLNFIPLCFQEMCGHSWGRSWRKQDLALNKINAAVKTSKLSPPFQKSFLLLFTKLLTFYYFIVLPLSLTSSSFCLVFTVHVQV